MRLKEFDPPPAGYFIRPSQDGSERGPLTLENLHDLAEFEHVTPEFWIRMEGESDPRPLSDLPDLMGVIFPQKSTFHFKAYEKKNDADAGLAPVDVKSLYRCEADDRAAQSPPLDWSKGKEEKGASSVDPRLLTSGRPSAGPAWLWISFGSATLLIGLAIWFFVK